MHNLSPFLTLGLPVFFVGAALFLWLSLRPLPSRGQVLKRATMQVLTVLVMGNWVFLCAMAEFKLVEYRGVEAKALESERNLAHQTLYLGLMGANLGNDFVAEASVSVMRTNLEANSCALDEDGLQALEVHLSKLKKPDPVILELLTENCKMRAAYLRNPLPAHLPQGSYSLDAIAARVAGLYMDYVAPIANQQVPDSGMVAVAFGIAKPLRPSVRSVIQSTVGVRG